MFGIPTNIDFVKNVASGKLLDPGSNPYLDPAIQAAIRPVEQSFKNVIAPSIQTQFAGPEFQSFGGPREANALGVASGEATRAMGDISSNIVFANYLNELDRLERSPQITAGALAGAAAPFDVLAGVGEQYRSQEAEQIAEEMARFQESVEGPFRPLVPLAQILQGIPVGQQSTQTSTAQYAQPSALSKMLTGGLGGGILGGILGKEVFTDLGAKAGGVYGIPIGLALAGLT